VVLGHLRRLVDHLPHLDPVRLLAGRERHGLVAGREVPLPLLADLLDVPALAVHDPDEVGHWSRNPTIADMPHFENQGVRLHYELHGPEEGPPTVFVNGYCSNYQINWVGSRWQETFVAAGRRVIGLEPRGHGASDKPHDPAAYGHNLVADVVALLDHLALERADYVGYSMGSQIGLRTLVDHPARVRKAVLAGLGKHGLRGIGPSTETVARRLRGDESVDDPIAVMFHDFAIRVPNNDLEALACLALGSDTRLTPEMLAKIRTPVLVAVGGEDPIARGAKELAGMIPGAIYFEVPGRDHATAVPARALKERALEFLAE